MNSSESRPNRSWKTPDPATQPFSPNSAEKHSRLRGAAVSRGVCPYCAVGCGQLIYTKKGKIIDIEGDPQSPINEAHFAPRARIHISWSTIRIARPRSNTALRTAITGKCVRCTGR